MCDRQAPALALVVDNETREVMTPASPRWRQFADLLKEIGLPCDCGRNRPRALTVLLMMGDDVDVAGSLEFFRASGARCDCTIHRLGGDDVTKK